MTIIETAFMLFLTVLRWFPRSLKSLSFPQPDKTMKSKFT